ncbi:MAG: hypothetical protein LRS43_01545 [Desulfurococcales archaeon]|nr:hypothetical protein [Desulfurococcales archaeon]
MEKRICPSCGSYLEEGRSIGGLCVDCFLRERGLSSIPSISPVVTVCKDCGYYLLQGGWVQGGPFRETVREYAYYYYLARLKPQRPVEEAWIEDVEVLEGPEGPGFYRLLLKVAGRYSGLVIREDKVVEVRVKLGLCPRCFKRRSKTGHEAVVQFRSTSPRLSRGLLRALERFLEGLDRGLRESIISVNERREGLDLHVADQASARAIASKARAAFVAKVSEAHKVIGVRRDGRRKTLLSISVRVPDLKAGDVVSIGGRDYVFKFIAGGRAYLVDANSGQEVSMAPEDLWRSGFSVVQGDYRSLLLSGFDGSVALLIDVSNPLGGVIEYPRENVVSLGPSVREGRRYKCLLYGERLYVIEEERENG